MRLEIIFENAQYESEFLSKNFEQVLNNTFEKGLEILKTLKPDLVEKATEKFLQLNIISDESITPLNNQYRNKNKPTDVLSWGFISDELMPNEAFGEIYIAYETAFRQAGEKQHSFEQEVQFLFAHGLLHVFEYDHQTDEEEREMDAITEDIVK